MGPERDPTRPLGVKHKGIASLKRALGMPLWPPDDSRGWVNTPLVSLKDGNFPLSLQFFLAFFEISK
jgi:hypothetical protein